MCDIGKLRRNSSCNALLVCIARLIASRTVISVRSNLDHEHRGSATNLKFTVKGFPGSYKLLLSAAINTLSVKRVNELLDPRPARAMHFTEAPI